MKKSMNFKLTNANIRLRYDAEAYSNPDFTFHDMAGLFHIKEQTAWRWANMSCHGILPSTKKCLFCGKSISEEVLKWLNDGKAMKHYLKFGGKVQTQRDYSGKKKRRRND